MEQALELAKTVLRNFIGYVAGYWPVLIVLVLLHLAYSVWTLSKINKEAAPSSIDNNDAVLDYFFQQDYKMERVLFQGRLGADYILTHLGAKTFLQIKWWSKPLGEKLVRALHVDQQRYSCEFSVLVSKEGFTRAARRAALQTGVLLMDLRYLDGEKDVPAELSQGAKAAAATEHKE